MPLTPLPTLPTAPNSIARPLTFNADSDAYFGTLNSFQVAYNVNIPLLIAASQATVDSVAAAATSEANALAHKNAAAISAGSAAAAAANLAALEALWLGTAAADPAVGKAGAPLVAGNAYVNSVTGYLRAYNGAAWVQGVSAVAGVSSLNGLTGAVTVTPGVGAARLYFSAVA